MKILKLKIIGILNFVINWINSKIPNILDNKLLGRNNFSLFFTHGFWSDLSDNTRYFNFVTSLKLDKSNKKNYFGIATQSFLQFHYQNLQGRTTTQLLLLALLLKVSLFC